MSRKLSGDQGEKEVCDFVPCPNCQNKLVKLPAGFPMYDIQCSRCMFRAQVKTVNSQPKNQVFGAGWDIYSKVMKAGYLSPPLFINFKWLDRSGAANRRIDFYPFIAKDNISPYILSPTARRANYKMFKYVKLDKIPRIEMYRYFNPSGSFDDTIFENPDV